MQIQLYPHIIADSAVLAGKPVIEGTQISASTLVAAVASGKSFKEVAREYGVTVADVRAALEYAAQRTDETVVPAPTSASASAESQPLSPAAYEQAKALGLDIANISPLGRQLLEQRAKIIASGEPLLSSWEEVEAEVAERRGERMRDDA
jgi:uncharacterized protein (DUF433 family)